MISLQRSMHSSQMYTPGPAMSFLTCFWLFPQNEHFSRSESPNFAISPCPPGSSDRAPIAPGRPDESYAPPAAAAASSTEIPRVVMISSMTPYSFASSAVRM